MMSVATQPRWSLDSWLLISAASLLALGLIMVASASVAIAERDMGQPLYYALRHGVFITAGLLAVLVMTRVPLSLLYRLRWLALGLTYAGLIAVLVPGLGVEVNGAQRWLNLGVFNLQVSEFAKLGFIVYLAGYLVRHGERLRAGFRHVLKPFLLAGLGCALLLLEPDFGAAVLLGAIVTGMVFLAGARLLHLLGLALVVLPVVTTVLVAMPYRVARLLAFRDPWADPFDGGFQLTQALIAIGRGEWLGVGLGGSVQKLFYLPEAHTDFLFAILAEELGLAGVVLVIALFVALTGRAFVLGGRALAAGHSFSAWLCYGIGLWFGLQVIVNLGVNMGLLPTKGLTLPLVSHGGSSMLASCLAVGILFRVGIELAMPVRRRNQREAAHETGEETA